ncbi:hypothetical protein ACLMJK_005058 [Lecanora helva]
MSSIHTAVPGSFNVDTTLPPKLDINVGARSHFFQPPRTPSASSSLHRSTASLYRQELGSSNNRKRSRDDAFTPARTTPATDGSHVLIRSLDVAGAHSPPPFVNTKYELAGGLDTPTIAALSTMDVQEDESQSPPNLHQRGGRGFRGFDPALDDFSSRPSSALGKEGNGRSRLSGTPPIRNGLGKMVSGVVGVAGRVLEFCKETAFRGFYAGGGPGYAISDPSRNHSMDQSVWLDADKEGDLHFRGRGDSPIPGQFPDEDYIPDYMSQDHTTPQRPSKRIQREKGQGEISSSWIMVNDVSRESSPSRLSHRKVPSTTASARRPLPKNSRRIVLPASRPSMTSHAGSPGLKSARPASFASTRSPLCSPQRESPIHVDLQRHAAKMRRRELEEDANLKRLNQQLKAMIKEGREALGSKIEVQDEPLEADYASGGYFGASEKG